MPSRGARSRRDEEGPFFLKGAGTPFKCPRARRQNSLQTDSRREDEARARFLRLQRRRKRSDASEEKSEGRKREKGGGERKWAPSVERAYASDDVAIFPGVRRVARKNVAACIISMMHAERLEKAHDRKRRFRGACARARPIRSETLNKDLYGDGV